MVYALSFPTLLHERLAQSVNDFFRASSLVDTVLIVNSCARGQAVPESDLDLAILVAPSATAQDIQDLEAAWSRFMLSLPLVQQFTQSSRFAHLHWDIFNGPPTPVVWDEGGGPDGFELEIGNRLAYSAPLDQAGPYFRQLQSHWLPYYGNDLWQSRLTMAQSACAYDLEHVPFFVRRGLYFQAFDRLYKAFQEFLQALFIRRRTWPLAYNKWVREQVVQLLGLPELYQELPPLLSVHNIESAEVSEKAQALQALLQHWVQAEYSSRQ